jgi:hypothetical protein
MSEISQAGDTFQKISQPVTSAVRKELPPGVNQGIDATTQCYKALNQYLAEQMGGKPSSQSAQSEPTEEMKS